MSSSITIFLWLKFVIDFWNVCDASTHWVVTEDGRTQAQMDSVFNLRRPYDLVAFMKQEERSQVLKDLKDELQSRKDDIDKTDDKDTGLEQKYYKSDLDCIAAGKPLPEFDLYISTVLPLENKGVRPEEHIDFKAPPTLIPLAPDCTEVTELEYSIHAFEHLEGMRDRHNLSGTPELGLKNAITHRNNVDDYGHLIYEGMKKNKTSWVLYNMAAFYWRIKGEPYHAVECTRRALHYSPRLQKDVALISLANVLHRARYTNEAAIVVHAALDISKELNVNHFTLGNIYAVLGEYNKSVICFENTLTIQPDFEAAAKRKHAILCHAKLEMALEAQHRSLQRTLNDLKDYQKKHDVWQQMKDMLVSEQVPGDVKMEQRLAYEQLRIRENSMFGEHCRMSEKDGRQVLTCLWGRQNDVPEMDFAFMYDLNSSEENAKKQVKGKLEAGADYSNPVRAQTYAKEPKGNPDELPTKDASWPSKEECDTHVQNMPSSNQLSTVFLSPENKGFDLDVLLNDAQGLKTTDQHSLPWYPPMCGPIEDLPAGAPSKYQHIKSLTSEEMAKIPIKITEPNMRNLLLMLVNSETITEEEVGQRILTALKQNLGPKWILYTLAGLYWRSVGNGLQGIECLRRALHSVPEQYKDVPLVNLANILYKWGRYLDAVLLIKDALNVSDTEPATHFFYGHLLWNDGNYSGAVHHYEQSCVREPNFGEARAMLRAIKCHEKFYQATQSAVSQEQSVSSCSTGVQAGGAEPGNRQTESRVICKSEHGEEKCIIETRTRAKMAECEGHCLQTCTITPVKLESCGCGAGGGGQACNQDNVGEGCGCNGEGKGGNFGRSVEESLFGSGAGKLEEVRTLCRGEECKQLRLQHGAQRPHIKLDYINGILHQKLIFVESPNDIHVEPHECMIYSDGSRSSGCSQEEFKTFIDIDPWDIERLFLVEDLKEFYEMDMADHPHIVCHLQEIHTSEKAETVEMKKPCTKKPKRAKKTKGKKKNDLTKDTLVKLEPSADDVKMMKQRGEEDSLIKRNVLDVTDSELPDLSAFIKELYNDVSLPSKETCEGMSNIDYTQPHRSQAPLRLKNINLESHIDLQTLIKHDFSEPVCVPDLTSDDGTDPVITMLQACPTTAHSPISELKQVLENLGGDPEPLQVIGTRIARALEMTSNSWVLEYLSALYWRVEGDMSQACDCLLQAFMSAPSYSKDVPLMNFADMLHQLGHYNAAIIVLHRALAVSESDPITHFSLANLYAAKGEWLQAQKFYESTLQLDTGHQLARSRLSNINCDKLQL